MHPPCGGCTTFGISSPFGLLSPSLRQVVYALLTRLPLDSQKQAFNRLVRLACVKHAASVRPEPGSNSPINYIEELNQALNYLWFINYWSNLCKWLTSNQNCCSLLKRNCRLLCCSYQSMFFNMKPKLHQTSGLNHVAWFILHCLVFREQSLVLSNRAAHLSDLFIVSHRFLSVKNFLKFLFKNFLARSASNIS